MRLTRTITDTNRAELMAALKAAPVGAVFELVDDPRTLAQNKLMWALLNEVSSQLEWGDPPQNYEPEDWKNCFMKAAGHKLRFMPAIDGDGVVALGYRSSKLTKEKFSDLIETIYSQGLQRGVVFPG
jgi:NinB protein